MRRGAGVAIAIALIAVLNHPETASAACPGACAKFEPPDGKTLLIIGQDRDSMDTYVAATGVVPGGFMSYTSIAAPLLGTSLPLDIGGGVLHAQYQVDNYPHSTIQIGLHMVNQLDAITLGLHDVNIQLLGQWIQSVAPRPVFLRIGYEFDGGHNAYDPAKFKTAWKRIVDRLRAQGVTNVAYVWHSWSNVSYQGHAMSAWYPGDGYVDWAAVSIFDQAWGGAGLQKAHEMADFANAHGKPLMIGESTPRGSGTSAGQQSWDGWFVPTLDFITSRGVKAWSYINTDWESAPMWQGQGWGDSRVQADPVVLENWMAEITKPRYLNASPTLFAELGA